MTSKIFISYSRRDKEKVTEIKKELETVTSATFLMCDYDVEGLPEQYVLDAVHGINECDIFLFMLSEYSQISERPLMEIAFAGRKLSLKRKRIYIINIDGCTMMDSFLFRWGQCKSYNWNSDNAKTQLAILLEPTPEHINNVFPKYHSIHRDGKWGFVNHKGEVVVPCKWSRIGEFNEGLALVDDSSGKYGYLDINGKRVIPCTWERAESFEDGMAIVKVKDGAWDLKDGVIDKNNNVIIPLEYRSLEYIGDGMFKYHRCEFNDGIINMYNERVSPSYWRAIGHFSDGLCPVQDRNGEHQYGYIDRTGEIVIPYWWNQAYDFSEGLAIVKDKDGKYGVIDIQGKVVIPCYHDFLSGFNEGLCAFEKDGAIGFINKEDEIIINAEWKTGYYYSCGFHNGRCLVKDSDGKYGYINKAGSLVIPYTWKDAEDFDNGTAWVKVDDTYKLIDIDGNYV